MSPLDRTAFAANPLVAGILPENVCLRGGRAVVGLRPDWPSLFSEVEGLGPVLSICRNSCAVLGHIGPYPEVGLSPCGHCGCGADGSPEFYFGNWAQAVASVERQPAGWLYAAEFLNQAGEVIHKICLTPEADFPAFREWVQAHQTLPPEAHSRHCRLRTPGRALEDFDKKVFLEGEGLSVFIQRLIAERVPARLVVGNDGMVMGSDLRPAAYRESGEWAFLSDDRSGLHLRAGWLDEVWIERVEWRDQSAGAVLKAADRENHLVVAFAAAEDKTAWNAFVARATRPFWAAGSNGEEVLP